ncbi:MAG: B-box zinc finger protein [Planctomycetota bacterium]
MAATKYCLTHKDALAEAFCRKCHRPVCSLCVIREGTETFCSTLCFTEFKAFKVAYRQNPEIRLSLFKRLFRGVLSLMIVGIFLTVGVHYGKKQFPVLESYDYLGKYLEKILP